MEVSNGNLLENGVDSVVQCKFIKFVSFPDGNFYYSKVITPTWKEKFPTNFQGDAAIIMSSINTLKYLSLRRNERAKVPSNVNACKNLYARISFFLSMLAKLKAVTLPDAERSARVDL